MRFPLLLLCLITTVAQAQQADAPPDSEFAPYPQAAPAPPPPPLVTAPEESRAPEPADAPRTSAPVLAEEPRTPPADVATRAPPDSKPVPPPASKQARSSRPSVNAGGATLIVTEVLTGLVGGALVGSAYSQLDASEGGGNGPYTGAMLGGLALGTASVLYQHHVPVGRNEALLAAGAATTGLMASLTLSDVGALEARERAFLSFASTQLGVGTVLLLTSGGNDVSSGDAALVAMSSLYGGVVTSLFQYLHASQNRRDFNFNPVLLAPAVGMALGGLLALPLELTPREVLQVGALPLAVGVTILWLGVPLAEGPTVAKAMLVGMGATFVLSTLAVALSSDATPSTDTAHASSVQALPVPVVMPAGVRNDALAVGPGLQLIF